MPEVRVCEEDYASINEHDIWVNSFIDSGYKCQ